MKERKTIRRLAPCSQLDIERLESWLTDMAAEGWHLLDTGGLWSLLFIFEKGEAKTVRYRLEPGKRTLDDERPTLQERELFEEMGWEYVTYYSHFFIYRDLSPAAPELHTDPEVQVMNLKRLRRKTVLANVAFLALLLILILQLDVEGFRFLITFGAVSVVLLLLIVGCVVADIIWQAVQSHAIVVKLKKDMELDHRKPWHRGAWYYRLCAAAMVLFYVAYLLLMLTRCASGLVTYGYDLEKYEGDPPFVTIQDLCPEGEYEQNTFMDYNTFIKYHSDCAPLNIEWRENAQVTTPEGEVYLGLLCVNYHETVAPWIARGLAEEYYRTASESKYFAEVGGIALPVDYAVYYTDLSGTTVIICDGSTVIVATLGDEIKDLWLDKMLEMLQS